jgi:hypothetical protein
MLNNNSISEENYNSLLRDIITENLMAKGDESTKASNEVRPGKLDTSAVLKDIAGGHSYIEEPEADRSVIPQRQKNDFIHPEKFKNNYNKIKTYEFSEASVSKEWNNI